MKPLTSTFLKAWAALAIQQTAMTAACSGAVVTQSIWITHAPNPDQLPGRATDFLGSSVENCGGWYQYVALLPNGSLRFVTGTLGSPFAWYNVTVGDAVDANMVLGNSSANIHGPHTILYGDELAPGSDGTWLFGFWTNNRDFSDIPAAGDCYGWVRLTVTAGRLSIVDDAAAQHGPGIIAGTLTPVPEPALGAMLSACLCCFTLRRRR